MQRFRGIASDTAGNVISSAIVTVKLAGTQTIATIFSDDLFTVKANPFTTDSDGFYSFYASNGRYNAELVKTGYAFPLSETQDILLYDPSSFINIVITGTNHNYNPANALNCSIWEMLTSGASIISGIQAGKQGQLITLINAGDPNTLTLQADNANSLVTNRILTIGGTDIVLAGSSGDVGQSCMLFYDTVATRWKQIR